MVDFRWRLSHARGYLGLGMVEEAAAELEQLPEAVARETEALGLRALVLQERQQWPALADAAQQLVARQPDEAGWWIAWAYATRRCQSLAAAEAILLEAERTHPQEATVQFNLGCYASLRGDLAEARRRVDRAIALDRTFQAAAATDPDLMALRGPEHRPEAGDGR